MNMDQAAVWLAGSILIMLGMIVVVGGCVVINHIIHTYWKPIRVFTADSFQPFSQQLPRYATEEELKAVKKQ
jgi:hypothetical protein